MAFTHHSFFPSFNQLLPQHPPHHRNRLSPPHQHSNRLHIPPPPIHLAAGGGEVAAVHVVKLKWNKISIFLSPFMPSSPYIVISTHPSLRLPFPLSFPVPSAVISWGQAPKPPSLATLDPPSPFFSSSLSLSL